MLPSSCPGPRHEPDGAGYYCPLYPGHEPQGETWDDFCEDCNAGRAEEIDRQVDAMLENAGATR